MDDVDLDNTLLWSAPMRVVQIIIFATVGWFLYLFFNFTSHKYEGHRFVNHFSPWSPIFGRCNREHMHDDAAVFECAQTT